MGRVEANVAGDGAAGRFAIRSSLVDQKGEAGINGSGTTATMETTVVRTTQP